MTFADTIRATRRRLGVTQAKLAELLGVTANCVALWERGERKPGTPKIVAAALKSLEQRADK